MNRRNVIKGAAAAAVIGTVEAVHGVPGDSARIGVERKTPELYVEISARETGKTQRLCAAVKDHCDRDHANVAVIISPHMTQAMIMERYRGIVKTCQRNGSKACLPGIDQVQVFTNPNALKALLAADHWFQDRKRSGKSSIWPDHPTVRWFFDEWDFHEDKDTFGFPVIPFVTDGYYATTLRRLRTGDDLGNFSPPSLFRTLMERASYVVNIRRPAISKLPLGDMTYNLAKREYSEAGQIFLPKSRPDGFDLPMGRFRRAEHSTGNMTELEGLMQIPLYLL